MGKPPRLKRAGRIYRPPQLYEAAGRSSDTYLVRKLAIAMLRLEIGRGVLIVGLLMWDLFSIRY